MLSKIRKNRIKSSIAIAVATFIAAAVIWPLFDFLWSSLISHGDFVYTLKDYILEPIAFGIIFGIISFFTWKPETKLEKKSKKK
jgi:hypothetical protein